ncbi:BLUE COPPER PROTEIN [Salix viminalis]|uniref:BLUE COPPER PROTEIN n=1 Tax=Salix viminalis TaxID=40686 RepID=A0A9Q0QAS2_SALVM|nr:BLUE COPPER PROTEIN [Salix viminalis]
MASTSAQLIFLCLSILFSATATTATDHIVGANKGWNPGMNYTLWANNNTFYVGDLISFRYQKTQYNVFQVNQTGYDNCTTEGALGNWTSGKDFIPLNEAKEILLHLWQRTMFQWHEGYCSCSPFAAATIWQRCC